MKPDPSNPQSVDYNKPVAYDAQGRPLYAHPPVTSEPKVMNQAAAQQIVHVARAFEPMRQVVSEAVQKRHDQSTRAYPFLNLSEGEYVISSVRRHPIGLVIPLIVSVLSIAAALSVLFNYPFLVELLSIQGRFAETSAIAVPILLFCALIGLGMFVVYYVYVNNKFFLTNESVIQEIQVSLFSRHEQTVSLASIEDASYYQHGILQQIINYGTVRLSTEGQETTYTFTYVAHPKQHIALLNNSVESFKNGRPVEG
jgi:hypothetical protein